MLCLYCNTKNQPHALNCLNCGKDISTPPDMKGHLGQLFRASEKVERNSITFDEFKSVVERMEDITRQVADDLGIPVEDDEAVAETVHRAQSGVSVTLTSLREFSNYLENTDKAFLANGREKLREAYSLSSKSYAEMKKLKEEKDEIEGV